MNESASVSEPDLMKMMEGPDEGRKPSFLDNIWLRFKKRAKITWSYKLYFFTRYLRVFFSVITYFIFSLIVTSGQLEAAGYGDSYAAFAIVGIATARLINTSFRGLGRIIRREQQKGTIEAVLSARSSFFVVLLGDLIYYYIYASSFFILAIFVGLLLVPGGFILTLTSISTTIVMVFLACLAHLSLALLSAAAILQFKEANPVTRAINWLQRFLGGMYYPTTLLFGGLQFVSLFLPLTYSMDGVRLALLRGWSLFHPKVLHNALRLLLFTVIVAPIGAFVFQRVYKRVRRSGTLAEY